jgi:hypothetical protein
MTTTARKPEPTTPARFVDPFGFEISEGEYQSLQADLDRAWQPPALLDGDLELYALVDGE